MHDRDSEMRLESMRSYVMPDDEAAFAARWGRVADAADAWGVSYRTARRYIDAFFTEMRAEYVWIVTRYGSNTRLVVPIGTAKPEYPRGNPRFGDADYQRALSLRRWGGDDANGA